jgi:hypothetical protein
MRKSAAEDTLGKSLRFISYLLAMLGSNKVLGPTMGENLIHSFGNCDRGSSKGINICRVEKGLRTSV